MLDPRSLVGEVLEDTYRLVRFIGSGGFGWVYEARELLLGQEMGTCALKLVRCANDEETRAFLGEVRAVAALDHGNIIRFRAARHITSGSLKGCLCLCMELAEECLEERLHAQRVLPETTVVEIGLAVADGLAYLHGRKMIHRDLKPGNIFRVGTQWKLGDLGLAQTVRNSATRTALRRGTLLYASPEVFKGEVGSFSDMWAFGVLLHEMLTGKPPFQDGTDVEVMSQIVNGSLQLDPSIAPPYDGVIQGCMARDRTLRWAVDRARGVLASGRPAHGGAPGAVGIPPQGSTPGGAQGPAQRPAPGGAGSPPMAGVAMGGRVPGPAVAAPGIGVPATAATRPLVACASCGASNGASDPVCCQCGRVLGGATDPGYLAVKYRAGRDMQDRAYLPEALKHFQQILALAPAYADVAQRVASIEAQMRATTVVRAKMVLTPLWKKRYNELRLPCALRYSADGHLVYAGSSGSGYGAADMAADIYRVADGSVVSHLDLPSGPTLPMAISPSGQLLATSRGGSQISLATSGISLWEVASGAEIGRFDASGKLGVEFSLDGVYLLTSDADGTHSMHAASGAKRQVTDPAKTRAGNNSLSSWGGWSGDTWSVKSAVVSPDCESVLYRHHDGSLSLWSLVDGRQISTVACNAGDLICLSATLHAAVQGPNDTICIYDMRTGREARNLQWIDANGYVVRDVRVGHLSLHPQGRHLVVGVEMSGMPALQVREVDSGRTIWSAPKVSDLKAVEFSPDGRYLAAAHQYGQILSVWQVDFQ